MKLSLFLHGMIVNVKNRKESKNKKMPGTKKQLLQDCKIEG